MSEVPTPKPENLSLPGFSSPSINKGPNPTKLLPEENGKSPESNEDIIGTHYLLHRGEIRAFFGGKKRDGTVEQDRTPVTKLDGKKFDRIPAYRLERSITVYMGHEGNYLGVKNGSTIGVYGTYALEKIKRARLSSKSKTDKLTSEEPSEVSQG